MKNKTKVILTSLLCAACCGLGVGGTYAIFTTAISNTNHITTAHVETKLTIESLKLYSLDIPQEGQVFANSGTAAVSSQTNSIILERITPGDEVRFNLHVVNLSSIAIKYKYTFALEDIIKNNVDGQEYKLSDWLEVSCPHSSTWSDIVAKGGEITDQEVSIKMKQLGDDDNAYQNTACAVHISLETIQADGQ